MAGARDPHGDLDAQLQRGGLPVRTRLLALLIAAIGPGDWDRFAAVAARARDLLPRADLEETLLQATLFFGFPRAVSAFERLDDVWPPAFPPAGGDVPADERTTRGRELFAAIYGRNDAGVRARLRSFHAAFHDFVLETAYGRILARPGLDPGTRELLAVTALTALDQVPQLVAHGRGALHFGTGRAAVGEAIRCACPDEEAAAELLRRI